jgi:hypothetical protein
MWDSPRLLNAAANGLLAVAFALLAYAGSRLLFESSAFPLRSARSARQGERHVLYRGSAGDFRSI